MMIMIMVMTMKTISMNIINLSFRVVFSQPKLSQCEGAQNSALFGYLRDAACVRLNVKTSTSISHTFKNITFGFHLRNVHFGRKNGDPNTLDSGMNSKQHNNIQTQPSYNSMSNLHCMFKSCFWSDRKSLRGR